LTQLVIKLLVKFSSHPVFVSALPWENRPSKKCVQMNEKNVDKFQLSRSVAPKSQLITRFDCRAAVCLPVDVQECL